MEKDTKARDTAPRKEFFFERATRWIGSPGSLVFHTVLFIASFIGAFLGYVSWDSMLLVLTTIVSLEAIYLAIFIQMSVNQQSASLKEVEEDVEGIQEDVEDIQEDIQEITEDVEEIQEDVEEMSEEDAEDAEMEKRRLVNLEQLTKDVQRVLHDLERFKKQ